MQTGLHGRQPLLAAQHLHAGKIRGAMHFALHWFQAHECVQFGKKMDVSILFAYARISGAGVKIRTRIAGTLP